MNIRLTFDIIQVNIILQALDAGPHKDVRQLIDYILTEANAQREAFGAQTPNNTEGAVGAE